MKNRSEKMPIKKDPSDTELNDDQIQRYSRQIILEEVGLKGMTKLLNSKVCIIGAGGLGCPAAQILAAVGVGNLRIIDADFVEASNLPRQYLHHPTDIGIPKTNSIKAKLQQMNPSVKIEAIQSYVNQNNIADFIKDCDFVIDASDNFATKYLINDACCHFKIPCSIAGAVQFFGQVLTVIPGETSCYRCIFQEEGIDDPSQSCSGLGVMNTVPTIGGILQANEAIKYIIGLEPNFINSILLFDLLKGDFNKITLQKRPDCETCKDLSHPFYKHHEYNSPSNLCDV